MKKNTNNPYAAFYSAFNASKAQGNPLTKEEQVLAFTKGRTSSLKSLSPTELNNLVKALNGDRKPPPDKSPEDRLRKYIIAIFHEMQYPNAAEVAKKWAEKMGVGAKEQRVCKPFNDYTAQELTRLAHKAKQALSDHKKGVAKGVLKRL